MIRTVAELDQVRQACYRMVTERSLAAAAAAVVPIPGADLVADIGLLANMLPRISERFELDHASVEKLDPEIAERVLVIASSLGNNVIGRLVTRKLAIALLRRMGGADRDGLRGAVCADPGVGDRGHDQLRRDEARR